MCNPHTQLSSTAAKCLVKKNCSAIITTRVYTLACGVYMHTPTCQSYLFHAGMETSLVPSVWLLSKQETSYIIKLAAIYCTISLREREREKSNLCIAALYQALSQVPTDSVSLVVVLVFSLENASCTWKHSCHGHGLSGLMARVSCLGLKSQLVPEDFPWLQFPSQSYEPVNIAYVSVAKKQYPLRQSSS